MTTQDRLAHEAQCIKRRIETGTSILRALLAKGAKDGLTPREQFKAETLTETLGALAKELARVTSLQGTP